MVEDLRLDAYNFKEVSEGLIEFSVVSPFLLLLKSSNVFSPFLKTNLYAAGRWRKSDVTGSIEFSVLSRLFLESSKLSLRFATVWYAARGKKMLKIPLASTSPPMIK
jgi:hypothetical protein